MTAPSLVNARASESTDFSGTSDTLYTPSGVTGQHTLVAWFSMSHGSVTGIGAPSGWTLVGRSPAVTDVPRGALFVRKPTGATPASSYSFTKPNNEVSAGIMMAFRDVDPDNPIAVNPVWASDTGNTDTAVAPSITTPVAECLLVNVWACTPYSSGSTDDQYSPTVTGGSDGTAQTTDTDYQSLLANWDEITAAGATGTRTATFLDTGSVSGPAQMYGSFALRPVASTGAPQTIFLDTILATPTTLPIATLTTGLPPVLPPRTTPLTPAERMELIQAPEITYDFYQTLVLDEFDRPRGDIASALTSCVVEFNADGPIYSVCRVDTIAELDWGRHRIQPWVRISGAGWVQELPIGVFILTAPKPTGGRTPPLFNVQGYDKLYLLHHPLDGPVSFPQGHSILGAVREILSVRGFGQDRIDLTRAADTLVEARTWNLDQGNVTYLTVINDLLSMVGYGALWADREGFAVASPVVPPDQRAIVWRYDAGSIEGVVHIDEQSLEDDYTERPNRWEVTANNTERETPPTPGDGMFVYNNTAEGRSSQQARGGLTITRRETVEASTQDDLNAQGLRIVAEDMHASTMVGFASRLNPYHEHRDVLEVLLPTLGFVSVVEQVAWTHDLFARRTTHTVRTLAPGVI